LKRRLQKQGFTQLHDKIVQLRMESNKDEKMYLTDCGAEVMSVPYEIMQQIHVLRAGCATENDN